MLRFLRGMFAGMAIGGSALVAFGCQAAQWDPDFQKEVIREILSRTDGQAVEPGVKFYYIMEHSIGAKATGVSGKLIGSGTRIIPIDSDIGSVDESESE